MRTVTIASDRFAELGRAHSRVLGRPDLALVVIPHPLAGLSPAEAEARGRAVGRVVLRVLGQLAWPAT